MARIDERTSFLCYFESVAACLLAGRDQSVIPGSFHQRGARPLQKAAVRGVRAPNISHTEKSDLAHTVICAKPGDIEKPVPGSQPCSPPRQRGEKYWIKSGVSTVHNTQLTVHSAQYTVNSAQCTIHS